MGYLQDQVLALINPDVYLDMEVASGNLLDRTANSYDAVPENADVADYQKAGPNATVPLCFGFGGLTPNEKASLGDEDEFDGGLITIAFWGKSYTHLDANLALCAKYNHSGNQRTWVAYHPSGNADELAFAITGNGAGSGQWMSFRTNDNHFTATPTWHYYVLRWDGTSIKIDIDGVSKSLAAVIDDSYSGNIHAGTAPAYIGGSVASWNEDTIDMAEFLIKKASISDADALALYQLESGQLVEGYSHQGPASKGSSCGTSYAASKPWCLPKDNSGRHR